MSFSHYLAHTNPLFLSMEDFPLMKIFLYKAGLIMCKYSNNLLPECILLLYLRNNSIHEHNTRDCHQLRVLHGAKTFSNISARIWNVLINKFNCDVSMSIFICKLKLLLLHNINIFPLSFCFHILPWLLDFICFTVCILCIFTLIFNSHIN